MSIAIAEQSQIDVYLERIQRFVSSVQAFKQRMDEIFAARTPAEQAQHPFTPSQEPDTPSQGPDLANHASATPVSAEPARFTSEPESADTTQTSFTPEDVDIDAILSSINFGHDLEV